MIIIKMQRFGPAYTIKVQILFARDVLQIKVLSFKWAQRSNTDLLVWKEQLPAGL